MTLDLAAIRARLVQRLAWTPPHFAETPNGDLDALIAEVERLTALAEAAELFNIYKTLEAHGITVDQVDIDSEGRNLYRWVLGFEGDLRQSLELWDAPHKALDAALSVLLWKG